MKVLSIVLPVLILLFSVVEAQNPLPLHTLDCRGTEDYRLTDGSDYRGSVNVTKSGILCMNWGSQAPHQHAPITVRDVELGISSNHNSCRNPFGEASNTVGCYTTDPNVRYEECNIGSVCEVSKTQKIGVQITSASSPLRLATKDAVVLSASTSPMVLYYTLNGAVPTLTNSQQHLLEKGELQFSIFPLSDGEMRVSAFGVLYQDALHPSLDSILAISDVSVKTFRVLNAPPETPIFYPPFINVSYDRPVLVSLQCDTSTKLGMQQTSMVKAGTMQLLYDSSGRASHAPGTLYTGPFWVKQSTFITAVAKRVLSDAQSSTVVLASYQIHARSLNSPMVYPPSGSTFYKGVKLLIRVPASTSGNGVSDVRDLSYRIDVNNSQSIVTSSPIFTVTTLGTTTLSIVAQSTEAADSSALIYQVSIVPLPVPYCSLRPLPTGSKELLCKISQAGTASSGSMPFVEISVNGEKVAKTKLAVAPDGSASLVFDKVGRYTIEAWAVTDFGKGDSFTILTDLFPSHVSLPNLYPVDFNQGMIREEGHQSFTPYFMSPLRIKMVVNDQSYVQYTLVLDGMTQRQEAIYMEPILLQPVTPMTVQLKVQSIPIHNQSSLLKPSPVRTYMARIFPSQAAVTTSYVQWVCASMNPLAFRQELQQQLQLPMEGDFVDILYPPPHVVFRLKNLHPQAVRYYEVQLVRKYRSMASCRGVNMATEESLIPLGCQWWNTRLQDQGSVLSTLSPGVTDPLLECRDRCIRQYPPVSSQIGFGILKSTKCVCFNQTIMQQNSLGWITAPIQGICDQACPSASTFYSCGGVNSLSMYFIHVNPFPVITAATLSISTPSTMTHFDVLFQGRNLQLLLADDEKRGEKASVKFVRSPMETCQSFSTVYPFEAVGNQKVVKDVNLPQEGNYTICVKIASEDFHISPPILDSAGAVGGASFFVESALRGMMLKFSPISGQYQVSDLQSFTALAKLDESDCIRMSGEKSLGFSVSLDGSPWVLVQTNVNTTVSSSSTSSVIVQHLSQQPCQLLFHSFSDWGLHTVSVVTQNKDTPSVKAKVQSVTYTMQQDENTVTRSFSILAADVRYDYIVHSGGTVQLFLLGNFSARTGYEWVNILQPGASCGEASMDDGRASYGVSYLHFNAKGDRLISNGNYLLSVSSAQAMNALTKQVLKSLQVCLGGTNLRYLNLYSSENRSSALAVEPKNGIIPLSLARVGLGRCKEALTISCQRQYGGVCSALQTSAGELYHECFCLNQASTQLSQRKHELCPYNASRWSNAGGSTTNQTKSPQKWSGREVHYASSALVLVFAALLLSMVFIMGRVSSRFGGRHVEDPGPVEDSKPQSPTSIVDLEMKKSVKSHEKLSDSVVVREGS